MSRRRKRTPQPTGTRSKAKIHLPPRFARWPMFGKGKDEGFPRGAP